MPAEGPRRSRGRRGGDSNAASAIHAAAVSLFAEIGYEATSIRAIAARANVDPALVHHYFGTKKQLHATVLGSAATDEFSDHLLARVVAGEVEPLVRDVLSAWDDTATRPTMLARLRSALDPGPAPGDYLAALFRANGDRKRGPQQSEVGHQLVGAVAAALIGMVIARYLLRIDPLASASAEEAVSMWAPTIRAIVVTSGPSL